MRDPTPPTIQVVPLDTCFSEVRFAKNEGNLPSVDGEDASISIGVEYLVRPAKISFGKKSKKITGKIEYFFADCHEVPLQPGRDSRFVSKKK